jgi:hypothetical protein
VSARLSIALLALLPHWPASALAAAPDDLFALQEVRSGDGRTAAEIADFDGDGRADLLQIVFVGVPPAETRTIRMWKQGENGELPTPRTSYRCPRMRRLRLR